MITFRIVAYLIGLTVGYWVLTLAEKEKDLTKTIGRVIAWIIIAVSLIGPVCVMATACCRHGHGSACGYSSQHRWGTDGWRGHQMGRSGMMDGQRFMGKPGEMSGRFQGKGFPMMSREKMTRGSERMEGKGATKEADAAQETEKPE